LEGDARDSKYWHRCFPAIGTVVQKQILKIWENYFTELYDRHNRPETLEAEPIEGVDREQKSPYIWKKIGGKGY
jgi:hypothetical protein